MAKDPLASIFHYFRLSHLTIALFSVVLGTNVITRKKEAIKLFKPEISSKIVESESRLVLSLSHSRILNATEYIPEVSVKTQEDLPDGSKKTSDTVFSALVLEYAPNSDLLSLLAEHGPLPEVLARTYFHQMVDAIEYLHTRGVCHLDIKPDNILLDENYCIKLADFGLALQLGEKRCLKGIAGTTLYLSPEMHLDLKYDGYQADLFALGITLFTMVSGILPFRSAKQEDSLYRFIAKQDFDSFWKKHEGLRKGNFYSPSFKDLIQGMLALEPKKRPSLQDIKNHPWFTGIVKSDENVFSCIRPVRGKKMPTDIEVAVKKQKSLDCCSSAF